jgi:hypothetical protein
LVVDGASPTHANNPDVTSDTTLVGAAAVSLIAAGTGCTATTLGGISDNTGAVVLFSIVSSSAGGVDSGPAICVASNRDTVTVCADVVAVHVGLNPWPSIAADAPCAEVPECAAGLIGAAAPAGCDSPASSGALGTDSTGSASEGSDVVVSDSASPAGSLVGSSSSGMVDDFSPVEGVPSSAAVPDASLSGALEV